MATHLSPAPAATPPQHAGAPPVALAAAVGLGLLVAVVALMATGLRTAGEFLVAGRAAPAAEVIAADFGPGVFAASETGYDGQQTYVIAREFPDLRAAADHLDSPRYRMLRIAPPALASVLPAGPPTALGLAIVNITGVMAATWGLAELLRRTGHHTGAAVAGAAPLLVGVAISTTEPFARGGAIAGLAPAAGNRHWAAVALMTAATMGRETTAGAPVLARIAAWRAGGRSRALAPLYLIPLAAIGAWHCVLGRLFSGTFGSRFELAAVLDLAPSGMAVAAAVAAVGLIGAWFSRLVPVVGALVVRWRRPGSWPVGR